MILKIRNLGIIESVDLELNGLTVLAGLNDTGKSFISKIIYALIKTIKDANSQDLNRRATFMDQQWISIRNILNSTKSAETAILFEKLILPLRAELINALSGSIPPEHLQIKVNTVKNQIINNPSISINLRVQLEKNFSLLFDVIGIDKKEEDKFLSYFNQVVIQQLFRSQINSLNFNDKPLEIVCNEGTTQILKLLIENNNVKSIELSNTYTSLLHSQDATIIDSPVIIQLTNLILKNRLEINRTQDYSMPMYYPDLISKFIPVGNPFPSDVVNIIRDEIICGDVIFEEKTNKIVYKKNNGLQIEGYNIANGIKVFGIIQLLLNSGAINKTSMLIIDEPEVHLHPAWQVKFAEIISVLAKEGIPILISSHSPYLLRAIPEYAKKYEIENITKFYFGEKHKDRNVSSFKDVTENLDPIYKAFAEPLQTLFLNS